MLRWHTETESFDDMMLGLARRHQIYLGRAVSLRFTCIEPAAFNFVKTGSEQPAMGGLAAIRFDVMKYPA